MTTTTLSRSAAGLAAAIRSGDASALDRWQARFREIKERRRGADGCSPRHAGAVPGIFRAWP